MVRSRDDSNPQSRTNSMNAPANSLRAPGRLSVLVARKPLLNNLLILVFAVTLGSTPAIAKSQDENEKDPARAAALIRDAIKARGGDAYSNIRSVVSRGQYTPFEKGASGNPTNFVDYVVYPGRERTEFGKGDTKTIQSNSETANWVYDATQKMIRDQTEEQVRSFQQGLRYDLDNLLRTGAQQKGVKLVYLGRREAWKNTFSEAVRVDFDNGGSATLHFDSRSKLPLMIESRTVTAEGTVNNETRFHRWVDFGGIQFPTFQDFYRDGKQSARVSFDTVSFNETLPDKLFVKPANIKEVK
jgi:outer membrane lipoprotein-sorting protein